METNETYLDENLTASSFADINNEAEKWQRLVNYLIDFIGFLFTIFFLIFTFDLLGIAHFEEGDSLFNWIGYLGMFTYYLIIESATGGKSFGKLVTRTRVVDKNGEKPGIARIALRTLVRFVPFEFLSIFFGTSNRMLHDEWSKTYVVKVN